MTKAKPKKIPATLPTVRKPDVPTVSIPRAKVLALVFNMMDPQADKSVGPEILAEYVGEFSQADVDNFVLHEVTKLPGYNLRDGLRILDVLTKWCNTYFAGSPVDES